MQHLKNARGLRRIAVALAAIGFTAVSATTAHASTYDWWDLDADGVADSGTIDTDGSGYFDVNALDTDGDGTADTWLLDPNEDTIVDGIAHDHDRDGVIDTLDVYATDGTPLLSLVDIDRDGVPETVAWTADVLTPNMYVDSAGNIVMYPEASPSQVDVGPFGQDILDALANGPSSGSGTAEVVNNSVMMGDLLSQSGNATLGWAADIPETSPVFDPGIGGTNWQQDGQLTPGT